MSRSGPMTRIPRAACPTPAPASASADAMATDTLSLFVERWKNKYEDLERKYKASLTNNQKMKRELEELRREAAGREGDVRALRGAAERLCREYHQVKSQCDLDADLMHKVMAQAGAWYRQNRQLKRQSAALLQALPPAALLGLEDTTDAGAENSSNEEVEFLKGTVGELGARLAALQGEAEALRAEAAAARLQEFEALEDNARLHQELEAERARCKCAGQERPEETITSETEAKEIGLDAQQDGDNASGLDRLQRLLQEVDSLKAALGLQEQERLTSMESEKNDDSTIALWEEKIRLAEENAQKALQRAERAEAKLAELQKKNATKSTVMSRINYFEKGGDAENHAIDTKKKDDTADVLPPTFSDEAIADSLPVASEPPAPAPAAPPPPPPPPPLPPTGLLSPPAPLSVSSSTEDMAQALARGHDTLRRHKHNGGVTGAGSAGGAAIDAIVEQIKGGQYQLRHRAGGAGAVGGGGAGEQRPAAVHEMLAILGTLRRRPRRPDA